MEDEQSELLDTALRALVCVGSCEGTIFQNEWRDFWVTDEQGNRLVAAVDKKLEELRLSESTHP